jgi:hypothetical protein
MSALKVQRLSSRELLVTRIQQRTNIVPGKQLNLGAALVSNQSSVGLGNAHPRVYIVGYSHLTKSKKRYKCNCVSLRLSFSLNLLGLDFGISNLNTFYEMSFTDREAHKR